MSNPENAAEIAAGTPMSTESRERLDGVRRSMLHLHKALLETERRAYEQVYGRIRSPGELLQLVIGHDWFAWLRQITELVVQIDETLEADDPATEQHASDLLKQVRALLKPDAGGEGFPKRYYNALQQDPDSILKHADVVRRLPPDANASE